MILINIADKNKRTVPSTRLALHIRHDFAQKKIICYHGQKKHFKETKPTKKSGSYTLAIHDNKLTTYNHSSLLRI